MPACFNCGEETDCDDEVGGRQVFICQSNKCRTALRAEQRDLELDVRERAAQDDYDRYR